MRAWIKRHPVWTFVIVWWAVYMCVYMTFGWYGYYIYNIFAVGLLITWLTTRKRKSKVKEGAEHGDI